MSDQNKSDDQSSQIPGIAIVALILGLFVFQDTAFKSSRPAMSDTEKTSTEDVRSRLWQDPFEAVKLHLDKTAKHLTEKKLPRSTPSVDLDSDYTYKLDKNNLPQRICNTGDSSVEVHSIEELRCQIQRDTRFINNNKADLHVLAVMVSGGPYAEDREWRLRNRYALISGLIDTGYQPEDPEHIGFVDFSLACKKAFSENGDAKFCDWPAHMPYEWFHLSMPYESDINGKETPDRPNRILVLWLDNDAFARSTYPLQMLGRLKDGITPGDGSKRFKKPKLIKPSFNVIGPYNSDTLLKIYTELTENDAARFSYDSLLSDSLIYSPFVTIDTDVIKNKINKETESETINDKDISLFENRFSSTVSTNRELASTLLCELMLREIKRSNPIELKPEFIDTCGSLKFWFKPISEREKYHIALIGESDTVYSRSLINSFKEKIKSSKTTGSKPENTDEWVETHIFNYLRGIDGINSEEAKNTNKNPEVEDNTYDPSKDKIEQQLRRPTGSNQFDYLRRLAKHLEDLENENKEGGINAIGILGSDAYDKLLILQALHKRFPQAIFFTTDLDARLLHSAEKKWARNLIVASSYGLKLHEDLQGRTPPFRDTYQASLYLATKLATNCRLDKKVWVNDPHCSDLNLKVILNEYRPITSSRLFEIGNHGAVDLSHSLGGDLHPEPETIPIKIDWKLIGLLLTLLGLITLFSIYLVPSNKRTVIYSIAYGLLGVMVLYVILQKFDDSVTETFSFTNGTSTWPSNAIRLFAIIIAISFFLLLRQQLKKSNNDITKKYINPSQNETDHTEKKAKKINFWPSLFIDCWGRGYTQKTLHFSMLWQRYRMMREFKYCWKRIFFMSVLYGLCIFIASRAGYFDPPIIPARGITSYYASSLIQVFSVLFYLILVFVIADITHLSNHFIKLLKEHNVIWPEKILSEYSYKYGISKELAENKVHMDFVSQLAGDVKSFIYFPFWILFLMILSRSHYFDNWHYTPLLLMVICFTALIALGSAIRLTRGAQETRVYILEKLDDIYWHGKENSPRLKTLTDEIKNLQTGPFLPLSRHPVVLSVLIPFGGVGSLYLIEYLTSIT